MRQYLYKTIWNFPVLDHDYDFLCLLTKAGSQEGMFRYCEPSDGPMALQSKLTDLFDLVSL